MKFQEDRIDNFLYELKDNVRVRRLKQIANRLNVSSDALKNIIIELGGNLEKNSNPIVSEEMVKLIAEVYSKSVHRLFEQAKEAKKLGLDFRIKDNFFLSFVSQEEAIPNCLLTWQLDNELIEESFYKIVNSDVWRTDSGSTAFNRIIYAIIRIVFTYYLDIKSLIKSILSPRLFFNYSTEEDANTAALRTTGFFVSLT